MIRQPAVAGYFYPGDKTQLENQLTEFLPVREKTAAKAIVVPHAGYIYSGAVAGEVYSSIQLPDTFIILCPNHTGMGSDFDLSPAEEWVTPLGSVKVDQDLCKELQQLFPHVVEDGRAHMREHSLEVQLPFLQYLKEQILFVPLCIRQFRFDLLEELGHALAELIRKSNREILLIASSDMTHYESRDSAKRKDQLAIEQMEKLDPAGLYETVHRNNISMCGYLPATITMIAARDLGASGGVLKKYATSGDVTGDYSSVVGYAGLIFN